MASIDSAAQSYALFLSAQTGRLVLNRLEESLTLVLLMREALFVALFYPRDCTISMRSF